MSKTVFKAVLILFAFSTLSLFAMQADISGNWELTLVSQRGEMVSQMSIEQDGEKIKVTMEGPRGDEMIGEGTFKENKAEWTVSINTPNGDFSIKYTGTLEGETLSGQAEMGDFGTMEWTAKKK